MSITISNCDEICHSPMNLSKAKMLYTFPRQPRFPKKSPVPCDKLYNLPQQRIRPTSLGYGKKYDFTKDVPKSPPCNLYQIESFVNNKDARRAGIGKGREQMQLTGPFWSIVKNKNPGPASYEHNSTLSRTAYSMKGKNLIEDKQRLQVPGPGAYEASCDLNANGKYYVAKHKSSFIRHFNHSIKRQSPLQNLNPGPGRYDSSKQEMSPEGKYVLSRMQNTPGRRFGTSTRQPLAPKSSTPGPGCYRLPSQFGHYIAKNAIKNQGELEGKQNKAEIV